MTDPVALQYETHPYPPRDPRDEAKRLVAGSPSHLLEVDHYVFAGSRDWRQPFRALVAGGGTGDGAIMLAQHLADRGAPGRVVYLDRSVPARAIAEARAAQRQLTNLDFVTASLLDLPALGLGPFDYIDCCGVLHHLEQPEAGLHALVDVLAPGGGLGLMVYGEIGRIGVYHAQEMLRLIGAGHTVPQRLGLARRLVGQLPTTNWLRRNPAIGDQHLGDAGLYDLLLHARDRAYRVGEVFDLVAGAGLRLVSFIEPFRYEPRSYLNDPALLKALEPLGAAERASFAELLAGNLKTHVFYAVHADNPVVPPSPDDPQAVPMLREIDAEELARAIQRRQRLEGHIDGIDFTFPVPALGPAIIRQIDGKRTLAQIQQDLRPTTKLDWPAFCTVFAALYKALNDSNLMLLRQGGVPST